MISILFQVLKVFIEGLTSEFVSEFLINTGNYSLIEVLWKLLIGLGFGGLNDLLRTEFEDLENDH